MAAKLAVGSAEAWPPTDLSCAIAKWDIPPVSRLGYTKTGRLAGSSTPVVRVRAGFFIIYGFFPLIVGTMADAGFSLPFLVQASLQDRRSALARSVLTASDLSGLMLSTIVWQRPLAARADSIL